jgi:hypothetical protein
MCVLSAKRRALANSAHDVSVHWGHEQGATHAVPAFQLAPQAQPAFREVPSQADRSLCGDAGGDRTRPSDPASVKDPGGEERGRDEVRLELG